jgi:hypothetical protein
LFDLSLFELSLVYPSDVLDALVELETDADRYYIWQATSEELGRQFARWIRRSNARARGRFNNGR